MNYFNYIKDKSYIQLCLFTILWIVYLRETCSIQCINFDIDIAPSCT